MCQLKTAHHLPLQGWSHKPLQSLTLNMPWKEFRVEIRNEALCALGKTGTTGLQIVRYFQEKILWAQFLVSSHIQKSTKTNNRDICSSWLAATFCQNVCLIARIPLHQNHIYIDLSSSTSLEQFLRTIWEAVSQSIVLILPQIKLNSQFSRCAFFSVDKLFIHSINIYLMLLQGYYNIWNSMRN